MPTFAVLALIAFPTGFKPPPAPVDNTVVRKLVSALGDADLEVRQNIAAALAKIGPGSVELLVGALKDASADRRGGAAYALGLIGPNARAALPELLNMLADTDVGVRRNASYAVGRIVPAGRITGSAKLPTPAGAKP